MSDPKKRLNIDKLAESSLEVMQGPCTQGDSNWAAALAQLAIAQQLERLADIAEANADLWKHQRKVSDV